MCFSGGLLRHRPVLSLFFCSELLYTLQGPRPPLLQCFPRSPRECRSGDAHSPQEAGGTTHLTAEATWTPGFQGQEFSSSLSLQMPSSSQVWCKLLTIHFFDVNIRPDMELLTAQEFASITTISINTLPCRLRTR